MKKLSKSYWDKFKVESKNGNGSKYDGLKFENLINELLAVLYGKEWVRTGKSHDDNRDFWTLMETEDGQNKLWAECKNYRDKIALDILAPTLVMAQIYGVNTIIFFLFAVISAMSGFWLDIGILASNNSTTISINFTSSVICLLVFAICPGYQFILFLLCSIDITSFL